jgi:hypothetical protein
VIYFPPSGDLQLGEIKSVETMIKNEKHYEYTQECAPRVEYLILKLKIIR